MQRSEQNENQIPKNVKALGFVSLFADIAGEMIYPLLPVFLVQSLGASPVSLGLIEGLSETVSAFFKMMSGLWSDRWRQKKPFILFGYALAGLSRPLLALASTWPVVLILRLMDRSGKGIRSAPRDALIADSTQEKNRGRSYGFHRAMDHTGGVLGPVIASVLMLGLGFKMEHVFLLTLIPGVLSVAIVLFFVSDSKKIAQEKTDFKFKLILKMDRRFLHLMISCFVFSLASSSDVFFLLFLASKGFPKSYLGLLWAGHHAVKMASTYLGGIQSDRISKHGLILSGWVLYAFVYFGFYYFESLSVLVFLFLSYGMYYGLAEPAERVLIAQYVRPHERGTAFGLFYFLIAFGTFPASLFFGWAWEVFSPEAAFLMGAGLSVCACVVLKLKPKLQS